jgi:hypothetical protein
MTERESIEELPTLEWRRLSEPAQSAILAHGRADMDVQPEAPPVTDQVAEAPMEAAAEFDQPISADPMEQLAPASVEAEEPPMPPEATAEITGEPPAETPAGEIEASSDADLAQILAIEPDEELPSVDDLDAAMAWLEELAASQDAPIEDVPSVADRALASKLMMEAGLPPESSVLDELGSDSALIEGRTPTHPFIEEEDFADTIVLVETMAAEQALTMEDPTIDSGGVVVGTVGIGAALVEQDLGEDRTLGATTPLDAPAGEMSFDEAMTLLDEMAATQTERPEVSPSDPSGPPEAAILPIVIQDVGDVPEAEELPLDERADSSDRDALIAEEAPWRDHEESVAAIGVGAVAADQREEESEPVVVLTDMTGIDEGVAGADGLALEEALAALDAIALPPGKTLDEIDAIMRVSPNSPERDVAAALAWLESALGPGQPLTYSSEDMTGEELIAQMPEDPDAILAWLEQMAAQEESGAAPNGMARAYTTEVAAPPIEAAAPPDEIVVEEVVEADLFEMPEDPDEAMAWLEGLARRQGATKPQPDEESSVAEAQALGQEATAVEEPGSVEDAPMLVVAAEPAAESAIDLEAVEPELVEPDIVELDTVEPGTVEPEAVEPEAVEPETVEPETHVRESVEPPTFSEEPRAAEQPLTAEMAEGTTVEEPPMPEQPPSRGRGRRKATAAPESPEPEAPPAPIEKQPETSWIDLLKPLD